MFVAVHLTSAFGIIILYAFIIIIIFLHVLLLQVAALVPQHELDFMIGENYENTQSRIMTQALRKIQYSLCHSRTLIIFINQVGIYLLEYSGLIYVMPSDYLH